MSIAPCMHAGRIVALAAACALAFAAAAPAAVSSTSGYVEARVEQLQADTGEILDEAFESTPGTTNILPATATASIEVFGESADLLGLLEATGAVNPPDAPLPDDPDDFGAEASGLLVTNGRGFTSTARTVEQRAIVFGAEELDLDEGTPIRVRSVFSLSAGVFLVNLSGGAGDVAGTVSVTVRQIRSASSQPVLTGSLEVSLAGDGQPIIATSGAFEGSSPISSDLSDGASEIDQARLVLLPALEVPYEYEAEVGESFTLEAEVVTTVNAPTGLQGGSAFLGQLPFTFTASVDELIGVDFGDDLVFVATGRRGPTVLAGEQETTIEVLDRASPCGNFGLEWLLGGLALSAGFLSRRPWAA